MFVQSRKVDNAISVSVDSTAVSIFVDILVELTNKNTVFVNSTNITSNIEKAALFRQNTSLTINARYLVGQ